MLNCWYDIQVAAADSFFFFFFSCISCWFADHVIFVWVFETANNKQQQNCNRPYLYETSATTIRRRRNRKKNNNDRRRRRHWRKNIYELSREKKKRQQKKIFHIYILSRVCVSAATTTSMMIHRLIRLISNELCMEAKMLLYRKVFAESWKERVRPIHIILCSISSGVYCEASTHTVYYSLDALASKSFFFSSPRVNIGPKKNTNHKFPIDYRLVFFYCRCRKREIIECYFAKRFYAKKKYAF